MDGDPFPLVMINVPFQPTQQSISTNNLVPTREQRHATTPYVTKSSDVFAVESAFGHVARWASQIPNYCSHQAFGPC